ncbi:MAG: helix-turn-helix domain-containing protein [Rhodospirillaceae bacterium]|nr:helix-turn-helix domain-containing protein [Rhodospirillaceae bacterium]MBT7957083.1 helix-turn-helix domain-containing protein [Rhodospirillaceae bacterium]
MCPSEVASKDGVSIKTVMRWIEDGSLPAYKLGGQWRISPRDHRKFRRERWNG